MSFHVKYNSDLSLDNFLNLEFILCIWIEQVQLCSFMIIGQAQFEDYVYKNNCETNSSQHDFCSLNFD